MVPVAELSEITADWTVSLVEAEGDDDDSPVLTVEVDAPDGGPLLYAGSRTDQLRADGDIVQLVAVDGVANDGSAGCSPLPEGRDHGSGVWRRHPREWRRHGPHRVRTPRAVSPGGTLEGGGSWSGHTHVGDHRLPDVMASSPWTSLPGLGCGLDCP